MLNISTDPSDYQFMVEDPMGWTLNQWILFPLLFVVPCEILAKIVDTMIAIIPNSLPEKPGGNPLGWTDYKYVTFNRLVLIPFVSWLNLRVIYASPAIVWENGPLTFMNTVIAFVMVFAMSDFVYFAGHRIVHRYETLYTFIHKHHHQVSHPDRGWVDTANAHPTDFFYTGMSTSPISSLWVMGLLGLDVHIYTIMALLYVNFFVGSLGHCRLDLDVFFFRTRFHAGHHANSKTNFAQNIELWDRLFGTYKEVDVSENAYYSPRNNKLRAEKKAAAKAVKGE
jgi:sterol desaturase/sphingolipid hydroxylase (fatty acid hydroxylase superfamily)